MFYAYGTFVDAPGTAVRRRKQIGGYCIGGEMCYNGGHEKEMDNYAD